VKRLSLFLFILILQLTTYDLRLTYAETATLAGAEKTFMEGRYEKAAEETKGLIDARSNRRDELYYLKGLSELKINRFKEAREDFESIISKFSGSKRNFDAHLGIGDAYFLEGNTGEALKNYNGILNKFPNNKNLTAVYYRLGNCYGKTGLADKANECFEKVKRARLSFESRMPPEYKMTQALPPKAKGEKGNFSIQAGYFKSRRNADRLSRKLSAKGYEARVEISIDSRETFYRTKVGRYKSRYEAESAASALKKAGYSTRVCADDVCQ